MNRRMLGAALAAATIAMVVGLSCGTPPSTNDDGDAAHAVDVGDDATDPDADPADAGPFDPRIVFRSETAHCSAVAYEFADLSRVPSTPGGMLWRVRLSDSPAQAAEVARWTVGTTAQHPVVGNGRMLGLTTDGGFVATLGIGVLARFDSLGRGAGVIGDQAIRFPTPGDPTTPALGPPTWTPVAAAAGGSWVVHGWAADDWTPAPPALTSVATLRPPDGLPMPEWRDQIGAQNESVGVLSDGTIVWTYGRDYIVGSCADGTPRWAVQVDHPRHPFDVESVADPYGSPSFRALRDGTFFVWFAEHRFHFSADGSFLDASENMDLLVEGCGFFGARYDSRTSEDVLTRAGIDGTTLSPVRIAHGLYAVTADCRILQVRGATPSGGVYTSSIVTAIAWDGTTNWQHEVAVPPAMLWPMESGGFVFGGPLRFSGFDADANMVWSVDHSSEVPASGGAWGLRPDGVLIWEYEVAGDPTYAAFDLGGRPARTAWSQLGTWAGNGALWMLPPP